MLPVLHFRLHFDHSFNGTFSSLSVSSKRFCFSANMDEDSELAKKAFNGVFPEILNRWPPKVHTLSKKPAESSKINKTFFKKTVIFLQNKKQLQNLLYEINLDISISKSTFYPSGNIKILPKPTSDYLLMNNLSFSNSSFYNNQKTHDYQGIPLFFF